MLGGSTAMPGKRVLVADDHPLSREGLGLAVRHAIPDVVVVAAGTVAEAEQQAMQRRDFRLVLLDLMMPDAHGFSGLLRLQAQLPEVPIAVITAAREPDLPTIARDLGATAFLSKAMPLDLLAGTLRSIAAGEAFFPPQTGKADTRLLRDRIASLSQAQRRVLFALADGRANKQIAHDLAVSEATIKAHLTAIFRSLNVTNRMQAMLLLQPLLGDLAA
jgi:DNA-binding NarL/FixJ family response regulator